MKTTIDLPEDLVRRLKVRAIRDGRKFKDLAAEYLRRGLTAPPSQKKKPRPLIVKDKKTGLPVVQCMHPAAPGEELTPDRIAELLIQQEVEWARESS